MARLTPDELQKQLDQQADIYGDGDDTISGSAPDPDKIASKSTEDHLVDVIGNEPDPEEDGFNLGDEVNEDEEDIQEKEINNYDEDAEPGDLEDL